MDVRSVLQRAGGDLDTIKLEFKLELKEIISLRRIGSASGPKGRGA
jgi:hypothetical protein